MSDNFPPDVEGYDVEQLEDGRVEYHSKNRRAKIVCLKVETRGGIVWNCELLEGEKHHGLKRTKTSAIAESKEELGECIQDLDEKRKVPSSSS